MAHTAFFEQLSPSMLAHTAALTEGRSARDGATDPQGEGRI